MARIPHDEGALPGWAQRTLSGLRERVALMQQRLPFGGRTLREMGLHGSGCMLEFATYCSCPDRVSVNADEANLVCSDIDDGVILRRLGDLMHKPVIDIDIPCSLVESSAGKFHLYIEKEVPWGKYRDLLKALADAGIVEQGYYKASLRRGYSAVRHPEHLKPTGLFGA